MPSCHQQRALSRERGDQVSSLHTAEGAEWTGRCQQWLLQPLSVSLQDSRPHGHSWSISLPAGAGPKGQRVDRQVCRRETAQSLHPASPFKQVAPPGGASKLTEIRSDWSALIGLAI